MDEEGGGELGVLLPASVARISPVMTGYHLQESASACVCVSTKATFECWSCDLCACSTPSPGRRLLRRGFKQRLGSPFISIFTPDGRVLFWYDVHTRFVSLCFPPQLSALMCIVTIYVSRIKYNKSD